MNSCKRMKVEAIGICVSGNVLYATNTPNGVCTGEKGKCGCTHAEVNLAQQAREKGEDIEVIFLSHSPCFSCTQVLIDIGALKTIVYNSEYRNTEHLGLFDLYGVNICNAHGWLKFD